MAAVAGTALSCDAASVIFQRRFRSRRSPVSAAIIGRGWRRRGAGASMLMQAELVWLLAAVAKGDEAAFERLYERHPRETLWRAAAYLGSGPNWPRRSCRKPTSKSGRWPASSTRRIASPITWMVAIARNRAIDIVRKKPDALDRGRAGGAGGRRRYAAAARAARDDRGAQRLLSCLGKLDPEKQRIVLLAYYSGWSRDQLAQEARYSGEYHQDLAAPQPARNPRVHGALSMIAKKPNAGLMPPLCDGVANSDCARL